MKEFLTIREASHPEHLGRSESWIRAAIRLGKIQYEKAGNMILINRNEINSVMRKPPVISRKEMHNL